MLQEKMLMYLVDKYQLASKDDTASAISLTANVGTSETIVVTNTKGTGEGAITLTSTAGGVDIDAAAAKDVNVSGGQLTLNSKDDEASAISLTANVGTRNNCCNKYTRYR